MRVFLALCAGLIGVAAPAAEPSGQLPTSLPDYVFKEDKSFEWKLKKTDDVNGTKAYTLSLISQTWHDVKWDHDLVVIIPKGSKPQSTMVLWNQGGTASANNLAFAVLLAEKAGSPVAFLYGVPKQALYVDKASGKLTTTPEDPKDPKVGRLVEDALIAETFVRYLATKDATWPLLYPMVKSVVRAMDAVQAFAKTGLKTNVQKFVITGASKRGWTSWLTAASGDKRVKAIAPLVIDTLNFPVQMKNQVAAFGKPSEMIADYTRAKLVPIPDTTEGRALWQMVDPYIYKDTITVPKMIINGTNDPYWPQDALNTYWDDLKGDKYLCYVPNAGHDLREVDKNGTKDLVPLRAVSVLAAFSRSQILDKPMPKLDSKITVAADGSSVDFAVTCDVTPKTVRVWECGSKTRDFRESRWESTEVKQAGKVTRVVTKAPTSGLLATCVETEFEEDGLKFSLCTPIRILDAKK